MKYFISCVVVMLLFVVPISGQQRRRGLSSTPVAQYSCPMHPAIKAKSAGRCPKCGMKLVRAKAEKPAVERHERSMSIPDVELLDQDGRKVHFYSDLVKGKTVAINFIFTTCTTICPPMGATFARVQKDLKNRDVHFISISVDPVTDTPERLKAWRAKFNAGPAWTLVTGDKDKIDELLQALAASTVRREDHSPTTIIGNDRLGQWTRAFGLAKPSQLVQIIDQAANGLLETGTKDAASEESTAAAKYFGEVELIDQDGRKVRFYSDVLKGKTVVINALFTTCTNVCPPISRNFERIQEALGERLGKDVFLVSITVDPENDTPERLKAYAQKFHARAGWSFLTGKKEDIDHALYKLGQYVQDKNAHKSIVIIGNEATGLWKKAFGLASADDLIKLVEEVMNDKPQRGTESTKNDL
ncbi:MAG TPA: SCO family protein [Pyrinomonadaceae bacterium]|nr:SCO family protein [Pyrinomonadaceae bacterium]